MLLSIVRFRLITVTFAVAGIVLSASCDGGGGDGADATVSPAATAAASPGGDDQTVADCEPNGAFTPAQTEGPYFKAGSPQKTDFFAEASGGTKLTLTGVVVSTNCTPIPRAKLDFWQADAKGTYDQTGFRLRGHQFTDDNGRFQLVTVVPGEYPGRTPHIHVKVTPPTGAVLTSQLYMPGEASNESDSIFNEALVMDVDEADEGQKATFTFVLVTG